MPGALIGEFYFLDQIAQAFACTDPHASVRIERHRREGEDADFHRCQSSAVAEGIASLASKSLVSLDASVPSGRWRLLENIRAYAFDKLAEHGETDQVARRHAEFVRNLFAPAAESPRVALDDLPSYIRDIGSGISDSITVGSSGPPLRRFSLVTASNRNLPAWFSCSKAPK